MVSSFLFIFAGMEKIYNYYQDIVTAYTRRADNLKKKIHLLGSIRLLLVAGLITMVCSSNPKTGKCWPGSPSCLLSRLSL